MTDVVAVLLGAAARGAIVLLVALVLTSLLHRRPAATRHAIWAGAIAVQLLLVGLELWGPRWHVPVPEALRQLVPEASVATAVGQSRDEYSAPAPATHVDVPPTSPRAAPPAPLPATTTPASPSSPSSPNTAAVAASVPAPAPSGGVPLRTMLVALWALGAVAVLLRLAAGTFIVARLARRGARIDDGGWLSLAQRLANTLRIQRPLILLRGDRLGVPVTWGIVYPIVLLPEDADEWTEERRRYVLVHEMAHVKRLDALTQLLGQFVLALFWFNPLVWIANRRLQLEREHACDDYVLRHGTQPSTYAADLLEMVQSLGTPAHRAAQPAFAALAMARRSEFEGRMLSILDPVLDRHPLDRGRTLMSAVATLLLVVPLAALQPIRPVPQSTASTSHPNSAKVARADTGRSRVAASVGSNTETITGPEGDAPSCDRLGGADNSTFQLHDNVDDHSGRSLRLLNIDHGHCIQGIIRGRFTTSPAEDRIATLSSDGLVAFRERDSGSDRAVTIRPAAAGIADALDIQFRLNGANAPFDVAAQRWVAGILPGILAEASINVEPRVARWRAEGGTDAVLRHISALKSSSAKRNHYEVLLAQRLPTAELERTVQQAGKEVPSSSDLRAVLSKAAAQSRTGGVATSALETAVGAVASSTDRTAVLSAFGQTDDRDQLLVVMRLAETIPSSTDKANLVSELAPRYLGRNDAALRDAFFKTVVTIPSSTDLASVLDDVIPFAVKSADVALAVIAAERKIPSSTDRANVLIALAERGAIRTPALHDAYLHAAGEIPSSTDMRNTLEALTRH